LETLVNSYLLLPQKLKLVPVNRGELNKFLQTNQINSKYIS